MINVQTAVTVGAQVLRDEIFEPMFASGFGARKLAEEVFLPRRGQRSVAVRRANHAELEWIDPEFLLLLQADPEGAAGVFVR